MHFQPNPEERYRIQSADFETYLEVRDVESGSRVIMRPRKNNNKQMWSFIAVARNTYKIQNAATEDLRHPLYLTLNCLRVVCEWDQPGLSTWTIVGNARGDGYSITTSGTEIYNDIYLALKDDGTISYIEEPRTNATSFTEDRTWRIMESSSDSEVEPPHSDRRLSDPPAYSTAESSSNHSLTPPPNLLIQGHTDPVYCATFSFDGKYIVSGSTDVRVWDAQTGNPVLGPLKIDGDPAFWSVAFSPNGRQIAAGTGDETVLVWDAVTGEKIIATPNGRYGTRVHSVSFSPDGRKIVSGSSNTTVLSGTETVQIWDAQTGINILSLCQFSGAPLSVIFSSDGKRIAVASSTGVEFRDANSGTLIWNLGSGWAKFVAFSLGAQRIISAGYRVVRVLNVDTGALVAEPSTQHAEGTLALEFNSKSEFEAVAPNGKWMADHNVYNVRIVDSKTGQVIVVYEGHTKHVRNITFSADSKRVLSASDDRTIRVHTLNL